MHPSLAAASVTVTYFLTGDAVRVRDVSQEGEWVGHATKGVSVSAPQPFVWSPPAKG